ncbi:P-loop containing nucleoside triphosphate hydrolase protein [Gonapodya prolifera JEL478]|uniref:p-loop containing nucleoside triphosphate hydrolase protein n=1 Tax=Gonapodya prolifera (strain JEL478) TaxID=1344416 RepID=A0A139AK63_GONPJ|nr:P-loop containing nucleoside triphosphate hydrolase protein [Gonapodya prolifera JEL478]|eukprot:KXS17156.1 P-loop containing nucleoside triphosphate hydrolase protein [Gonapodya prolifera JEL478]
MDEKAATERVQDYTPDTTCLNRSEIGDYQSLSTEDHGVPPLSNASEPSDLVCTPSATVAKTGGASPASKRKERTRKSKEAAVKTTTSTTTPTDSSGRPSGKPKIVALSQQSRFHAESIVTENKDVDIAGVTITVGTEEILVDTRLRFTAGVHYGLVGRNGVGKSTLLRVLGAGTLIGWPSNVSCLYVEQELVGSSDRTPLQSLMDADVERTRLVADVTDLESALDEHHKNSSTSHTTPAPISIYVRRIIRDRARAAADVARDHATKRSGERGKAARRVQLDKEAEEKMAREEWERVAGGDCKDVDEEEDAARAGEMLREMYEKLREMNADEAESRALEILHGLGFVTGNKMDRPTNELSGGWRMRLALARALFMKVDVLLLDEPTNHLDLPTSLWLLAHLQSLTDTTLVVVSHDRYFLNEVAEDMILYKDKTLRYYTGNYDTFVETREQDLAKKIKQQENLDRQREHMKETIEKGVRHARRTGDDKALGMVASRKTKLENSGLAKTADGKRWKESYYGFRLEVQFEAPEKEVSFDFGEPSPPIRSFGPILQLNDVGFSYEGKAGKMVLEGVVLGVEMGSRIGIMGPNGAGKSTLLHILTGELQPTRGELVTTSRPKIAYFSQHHVDALGEIGAMSPLQYLAKKFEFSKEQEVWNYLGRFGLGGAVALRRMDGLSGGEKARVVMATIMHDQPHIICFDEPTNHMDIYSIAALSDTIKAFPGGVIVVSHDVRFITETCQEVYALREAKSGPSRLALLGKGTEAVGEGVQKYLAQVAKKVQRDAKMREKELQQKM